MSVIENLKNRLNAVDDGDGSSSYEYQEIGLKNMQSRLMIRGGTDQWTRMRQDKLKDLKKALLYSYQSAIVQRYDINTENDISLLKSIINKIQNNKQLTIIENNYLDSIGIEYSYENIVYLNQILEEKINSQPPLFRCLINHDKLKVDYEDKIISIPFAEAPVGSNQIIDTEFHNGTVFKWVHGNKEEWTPDTYWIVYMQYSEETAYFRAEIRKADEEIEIVIVDDQGKESSVIYRGWTTGPNETSVVWHTKKNITWNDLNYTKLLYITKDENTSAFFERFDRVMINGEPWEVQAYNDNYSTSKTSGGSSGIIRVALKQTYTNTDNFIKQKLADLEQKEAAPADDDLIEATIVGPTVVKPYSILNYTVKNVDTISDWILDSSLAKITKISQDKKTVTIEILTGRSNKKGFNLSYGELNIHITIESF